MYAGTWDRASRANPGHTKPPSAAWRSLRHAQSPASSLRHTYQTGPEGTLSVITKARDPLPSGLASGAARTANVRIHTEGVQMPLKRATTVSAGPDRQIRAVVFDTRVGAGAGRLILVLGGAVLSLAVIVVVAIYVSLWFAAAGVLVAARFWTSALQVLLRSRSVRMLPGWFKGEVGEALDMLAPSTNRALAGDYILYLRSFSTESPERQGLFGAEARQLAAFSSYHRIVAVGRPDDQAPSHTISRLYFADTSWQESVIALATSAKKIVIRLGESKGLQWELETLTSIVPLRECLFLNDSGPDAWDHLFSVLGSRVAASASETPSPNTLAVWFDTDGSRHDVSVGPREGPYGPLGLADLSRDSLRGFFGVKDKRWAPRRRRTLTIAFSAVVVLAALSAAILIAVAVHSGVHSADEQQRHARIEAALRSALHVGAGQQDRIDADTNAMETVCDSPGLVVSAEANALKTHLKRASVELGLQIGDSEIAALALRVQLDALSNAQPSADLTANERALYPKARAIADDLLALGPLDLENACDRLVSNPLDGLPLSSG